MFRYVGQLGVLSRTVICSSLKPKNTAPPGLTTLTIGRHLDRQVSTMTWSTLEAMLWLCVCRSGVSGGGATDSLTVGQHGWRGLPRPKPCLTLPRAQQEAFEGCPSCQDVLGGLLEAWQSVSDSTRGNPGIGFRHLGIIHYYSYLSRVC